MKRKEIVVTIDQSGNLVSKIGGIKGAGCSEIAQVFKNMGTVTEESKTAEYYQKVEMKTSLLLNKRN